MIDVLVTATLSAATSNDPPPAPDAGQMQVSFKGTPQAELFGRIVNESFAGTMTHNLVRTRTMWKETREKQLARKDEVHQGELAPGFIHASPEGQGWFGSMWTRDGGTYLRELTLWGAEAEMRLVAHACMDLVGLNEEGFQAYPEYFKPGKPNAGHEWDGTGSIIIALALVSRRLPAEDPLVLKIRSFLLADTSPLRGIITALAKKPLIAGSGEFGPGCFLKGKACNVVQNGLVRLALLAGAQVADDAGQAALAQTWRTAAGKLGNDMLRLLLAPDGGWLWCLTPGTLQPDPAVLNAEINDGFVGILGVFCMQSDWLGLVPDAGWVDSSRAAKTLERLWAFPRRQEMFQKFGICLQFNRFMGGTHASPSYGHGYFLQSCLLLNRLDLVETGLHGLATWTHNQGQRRSPYFIFEQWRLPPVANMAQIGCGELNLVNVTETLKVARMIFGVDDRVPGKLHLVPRLPPTWNEAVAERVPVQTPAGIQRATIHLVRDGAGVKTTVTTAAGKSLEHTVAQPSAAQTTKP